MLNQHWKIINEDIRKNCVLQILHITEQDLVEKKIQQILQGTLQDDVLQTAIYQIKDWIAKLGYADKGLSYWECMRNIFRQIIFHNICKANKIQNGQYGLGEETYRVLYDRIDFIDVLDKQNSISRDVLDGYIWVLNTCVLLVGEYKFFWK